MDNKDKTFGIYSLLLPIIIAVLFFFNIKFGTATADTTARPFGIISDFIKCIVELIICVVFIKNILLYSSISENAKIINKLILIANIVLCIQLLLTIENIWALIFTFVIVQPIYLIIWLIYLIYFIINYE